RLSLSLRSPPPPPPTSTLFPYTTLFRSRDLAVEPDLPADRQGAHPRRLRVPPFGGDALRVPRQRPVLHGQLSEHDVQGDRGEVQDRKSTRLNSSHVSISYAVFCLKKKKK